MFSSFRYIRNLPRYQRIARVLAQHGFGYLLEATRLDRRLGIPRRIFHQEPDVHVAPAEHLRLALEELGPTFIKIGQILSTRPDLLPPEYIAELSKLQDAVPPAPWDEIHAIIRTELKCEIEELFAEIEPEPMAAASLAQVHAAHLKDGSPVVVKVQRPHILETIHADLEILHDLASLVQKTPLGEMYNPVEVVSDFAFTLMNELDYLREGRNADRFRQNFADESHLYIPRVYWEYTTSHVLVLEWIRGIKIDDIAALDAAGYDRKKIALHSARIIIKEVLEDGFFHADPHPGNLVVMPGEVIGAMDFGMVGYLHERDRTQLIRLYIVSISLDANGIAAQLIQMGFVRRSLDRSALERDINRLLTKYYGLPLKAIRVREVVEEIMPISFRHHLQLPSDLWLLGKTLGMMQGVGLQLDPDFDLFAVSEPFTRRLLRQLLLPRRSWGRSLVGQGMDWADLASMLPKVGQQLLQQAETGELFEISIKGADNIIKRLDRIASRLTLSLLLAALIIGITLLIPAAPAGSFAQLILVAGFVSVAILGGWVLISIIRGR